jgi:hypothetical protein
VRVKHCEGKTKNTGGKFMEKISRNDCRVFLAAFMEKNNLPVKNV